MYKPLPFFLLLVLSTNQLHASDFHNGGARARALSNAYVSIADAWSSFHNQAGLAQTVAFKSGVFYESRFLIEELSINALTAAIPVKPGVIGLNLYRFGRLGFHQTLFGFAFAKRLSDRLNAAIQLDYIAHRFPENSRHHRTVTFETGLLFSPAEDIHLGLHIFNPVSASLHTPLGKKPLDKVIRMGGHYVFHPSLLLIIECEKLTSQKPGIKSGIEYSPMDKIAVRAGVSGKPFLFSCGLGYTTGRITTDISFNHHTHLGITPCISILYSHE